VCTAAFAYMIQKRERKKTKRSQIRPRLRGAWITFESGPRYQTYPAFRPPPDIGQLEVTFFFFIPHTIPHTWVLARSAGRARARSRRDKAREGGSRRSICSVNYTRRVACRNGRLARETRSGMFARYRRRRRRRVSTAPDTVDIIAIRSQTQYD